MTWTRKELKEQAKEALQRNYWKIVLVSFLAMLFCSGLGAGGGGGSRQNTVSADTQAGYTAEEADLSSDPAETFASSVVVPEKARLVGMVVFLLIALLFLVFLYILEVLLAFPFRVGVSRFLLKSIDDTANVREITYAFDHSYKNVVKAMFHYDIRIFLWSLLFIIPGLYKQYQYRMVPYILAEHPEMDYHAALQKSTDMMNGHKWKAFLLDLSFIPWHILGLMTCGIVEIFYVAPYYNLSAAALYRRLGRPETPLQDEAFQLLSDTV